VIINTQVPSGAAGRRQHKVLPPVPPWSSHARTQADPHRSFVYRGSFTPADHLPDRAKMKNGKRIRDFPAGLPQRDLSG